ncbi:MAG TPA: glycosyltransferase family 4 protein [Bryobacteraceae bacterium]|nr:glycosyltransferase family 4 protein [Bryobacteraceae bacterium]
MKTEDRPVRVLYSFPHKLGAGRICYTAWQQVRGLAGAGAEIAVCAGVLHRAVPSGVRVYTTLSRGKLRIPYKLLGTERALALHDYIVSKRIEKLANQIDVIHAWPGAAKQTLKAAARSGIPVVLERPNAHTRYAYESVAKESKRLGITLPPDNEYAFKPDVLAKEEEEFRMADYLLCPSDFVRKTFLDRGFPPEKLLRHQYGYDETAYHPADRPCRDANPGLTMLFVGDCAVRKGLHFALDAWLQSAACQDGTFLIAGRFLPAYAEKLSAMLNHPSVRVLGFRNDIPQLMRQSDILILPSIEEGSALVTSDARGSGCVLLVSEAAGAICAHGENALIHSIGDVPTISRHITLLHQDRALLERLRENSLRTTHEITWTAAAIRLLNLYREVANSPRRREALLPPARELVAQKVRQ